jgi:hypothetical protein
LLGGGVLGQRGDLAVLDSVTIFPKALPERDALPLGEVASFLFGGRIGLYGSPYNRNA